MQSWLKYSQTFITGLLGLALLVGINVLVAKHPWQFDATSSKKNSLSSSSVNIVLGLKKEVRAVAFIRPREGGKEAMEDLLQLYAAQSKLIQVDFVDPDRHPLTAKEYGVVQSETVVLVSGDKRESVLFPTEEKLTNAIIRVTNPKRAKVYFIQGHGELSPDQSGKNGVGTLRKALTDLGMDTAVITLVREKTIPQDADALLILGPKVDFLPQEIAMLSSYAAAGRIFLAFSAETPTNLVTWMGNEYGVEWLPGLLVDPVSSYLAGDASVASIQDYSGHPITRDFNLVTLFPTAGGLALKNNADAKKRPDVLGMSSPQSWLESDRSGLLQGKAKFDEGQDKKGPIWLAVSTESKAMDGDENGTSRAVLFADQDFLSDQYIVLSGNLDLVRNSVNWLTEQENLISISEKSVANKLLFLNSGSRSLLTLVPLFFWPMVSFVCGILVFRIRRRRA